MSRLDWRSVGMVTSSVNRGSADLVAGRAPAARGGVFGTGGGGSAGGAAFAGAGAGFPSSFFAGALSFSLSLSWAGARRAADDSIRLTRTKTRPMQRIVLDMGTLQVTRGVGEILATVEILTQQGGAHKAIPHRHDDPAGVRLTAT